LERLGEKGRGVNHEGGGNFHFQRKRKGGGGEFKGPPFRLREQTMLWCFGEEETGKEQVTEHVDPEKKMGGIKMVCEVIATEGKSMSAPFNQEKTCIKARAVGEKEE